jgi:hypothetical protein
MKNVDKYFFGFLLVGGLALVLVQNLLTSWVMKKTTEASS